MFRCQCTGQVSDAHTIVGYNLKKQQLATRADDPRGSMLLRQPTTEANKIIMRLFRNGAMFMPLVPAVLEPFHCYKP